MILKKIKMLGDPNKFSWSQAFSDKSGKTSVTSILTFAIVMGSMFVFIVSAIAALFNIANAVTICSWSVGVLTLGTGGTIANKVIGGKPIPEDTIVDPSIPEVAPEVK